MGYGMVHVKWSLTVLHKLADNLICRTPLSDHLWSCILGAVEDGEENGCQLVGALQ
jgi:hypothetical protein